MVFSEARTLGNPSLQGGVKFADHEQLTYRHAGRDNRLTDVAGKAVTGILA